MKTNNRIEPLIEEKEYNGENNYRTNIKFWFKTIKKNKIIITLENIPS